MQINRTKLWSVACLCDTWATAVFFGFFGGQLTGQSKLEAAEKAKPEKAVLAKTASGPYTITVDRARWDFGKGVASAPSGLPMQMPMQTFGKNETHTFGEHKRGGTPEAPTSTTTGGMTSGGGGGGVGGGGWGGAFFRPNLILDLQVKNPQLAGKRQLICVPKDKVRALDDQGRPCDSTTDPPSMRTVLPGVEYPQGDGRMALHLYVPPNPAARYIQSIDGELLVAEASIRSATFQGSDLMKPTTKRAGSGPARLCKLQQSSAGVEVGIIAPPLAGASRPQTPLEQFQSRRNGANQVTVELVDSEGKVHPSTGSSAEEQSSENSSTTQNLPGGGTGTFTMRRGGSSSSKSYSVSGSSSGGMSGSGGGTFNLGGGGMNQQPKKAIQEGTNLTGWKSPNEKLPATNFRFDPLPEGVKIKSIRCTITDSVSPPKTVPFHLENIRLP
jgi:hypothetical protein